MTDISPAAKAVVAAIEKFDWESGHFCREDIWTLSGKVTAAALRAAANELTSTKAMLQLQTIAEELDGANSSESD